MSTAVADEKLMQLIREIQARRKLNPAVSKPTWMEIIGTSPGDELDREAARLGREWRKSEGLAGDP